MPIFCNQLIFVSSRISSQNAFYFLSKYLCNAFFVKAYVLLIAIRLSDGDITTGEPLGDFDNNTLMWAPAFSFALPYLTVIIHRLQDNITHVHRHSSLTSPTFRYITPF
jgi:hypothetical protein